MLMNSKEGLRLHIQEKTLGVRGFALPIHTLKYLYSSDAQPRPHPQATDQYLSVLVRNWAAQQEVSLNVMHLNLPQTMPHPYPVHGQIVIQETGPWG